MHKILALIMLTCVYIAARGQATPSDIDLSRLPVPTQPTYVQYWFDDDIGTLKQTDEYQGSHTLDVTSLPDCLHTVHYLVIGENGLTSNVVSAVFMKMKSEIDAEPITAERMEYWFDDDTEAIQDVEFQSGFQILDVSALPDGLHTIHCQMVCNNGALTSAHSSIFLKHSDKTGLAAAKSLRYWFDDQSVVSTMEINTEIQTLDVSSLMQGLHTIHYQLVDANGNVSSPVSSIFMKMPNVVSLDGKNVITGYMYWVNDKSMDNKKVDIPQPSSTYSLTTLLPMTESPIRSSDFHFEINEGVPTMYAKNDIHFRFYDAVGYWTDDSRSFIDYNVSNPVTDIEKLVSNQTFDRPEENGIKWFKFEAAPGDTVAFRSSQATSIQVFAPSGKEIYAASGDKSVEYGGTHTWEDGTHYVAVHDVTGSKPIIKLDYMHMDKYDVVSQDVYDVGNGGCTTITFYGNGFRDLYDIVLTPYLVKDTSPWSPGFIAKFHIDAPPIHPIEITHISDSEVAVTFDFSEFEFPTHNSRREAIPKKAGGISVYDYFYCSALFKFTEGEVHDDRLLRIEETKEIELALRVDYPNRFLRGTTADFVIQIENKGNVMAYDVPIELQVSSGSCFDNITSVRFFSNDKEFNQLSIDLEEKDSMDIEVVSLVERMIANQTGLHNFVVVKRDDATEVGISHLLVTVPPLGKEEIKVSIRASDAITLQALISSDWTAFMATSSPESMAHKAKSMGGLCCYKERIQCTVSAICDVGGLFPAVGCLSGAIDLGTYTVSEFGCAGGTNISEKIRNLKNSISKSTASNKVLGAALGCAAGAIGKALKALKDKLKNVNALKNAAKEALEQARKARDNAYELYLKYRNKSNAALEAGNYDDMKIFGDMADDYYEDYKKFDANRVYSEGRVADLEKEAGALEGQILQEQGKSDQLDHIGKKAKAMFTENDCVKSYTNPPPNCPPRPKTGGGSSTPVNSFDPNEIYGYIASSGSMFVGEDVVNLPYRIEFENDTTFATSAAHTVVVKDTLDAKVFDLSTFQPTSFKIGDKSVQLKGEKEFVTTVDMRPAINAIAQVEGKFDEKKGIATWTFTSLDPMTMETTDDVMQGFLPVNYDGSGIGEVAFNINRKAGLADGTEIKNRASIVFDVNGPILTPTWTNIIDAVAPSSHVKDLEFMNDTIVRVHFDGEDNRSGIWKYALYVQYGENASWNQVAEVDTTCLDFRYYEDIDYGFCVLATDSAGNVEKKVILREFSFRNGEAEEMTDAIAAPVVPTSPAIYRAYDLNGRLVQDENQKGIIIKNRKKIAVK